MARVFTQAEAKQLGLRSEEHTSELQSQSNLVCRLLLEKKKKPRAVPSERLYYCDQMPMRHIFHQPNLFISVLFCLPEQVTLEPAHQRLSGRLLIMVRTS